MANILFTPNLVEAARRSLQNGDTIFDALVIVGGHHFEMGKHKFAEWCEAVKKEVPGSIRQFNRDHVLAEAYVRMRDRAFELARVASNRGVPQVTLSDPLNAFMRISRPTPQVSQPPAASTSVPMSTSTGKPVREKETGAIASRPAANEPTVGSVPHGSREESPLEHLLAELHSHIGLVSVKKDIGELANSISVDRARRARGLRVADRSLHMVFYGTPTQTSPSSSRPKRSTRS